MILFFISNYRHYIDNKKKKSTTLVDRNMICHLFNDMMTFSQYSGPVLRIKKKLNLNGLVISKESADIFRIGSNTNDSLLCKCLSQLECTDWLDIISEAILQCKAHRRRSLHLQPFETKLEIPQRACIMKSEFLNLVAYNIELGPRAQILSDFCSNDILQLNQFDFL